jgi:predicted N-acyltransferase
MKDIRCIIVDSVGKIRRNEWDEVFGDIPEGYQFCELLERSCLQEFRFFYLLLREGDNVILIAPLFVADFNLDIAADGWVKKLIQLIRRAFPRFLILKTLFCGSPFSEHGILGIRDGREDKDKLILETAARIDDFCRDKRIPLTLFKDFLKEEALLLDALVPSGFFRVNSFPSAITGLDFSSFEEYLKSLGHSTRKSLRRKIKETQSASGITVKEVEQVDDIIDEVYRLYLNTHYEGMTKFERLTREFFLNAGRQMAPYARFFLYYVNGRLGAFNLCFIYPDLFIDKFIGFDYDISNKAHLYFVSWCYNIEWCLKHKIRSYQTGQTDYSAKVRLGAKLVPLYAYLKHRKGAVNLILRLLARFLKPENFDADIRGSNDV